MNRERFKFRIWDKKRDRWLHSPEWPIHLLGETVIMGNILRHDDDIGVRIEDLNELEILQNTGLKDKNGKEIYEGDIVKTHNLSPHIVKFGHQDISHDWQGVGFYLLDVKYPDDQNNIFGGSQIEIIGNIYEHKDLLND